MMVQLARPIRTQFAHGFAALALAWSPAGMADAVPAPPANALILFGAHWCAPCGAELRDLGTVLARLSNLDPTAQLVLAWIDRPVAVSTVNRALDIPHEWHPAPPRVIIPTPAAALGWAEPHLARARGYPFAALTDSHGTVCALHQGALQSATLAELWAACHKGQ